ncbi:MAG: SulP family inorganic anion transporter [Burkholderiaceae bacterium]
MTGGFPVTGGFSRSVVNFDAGARTPRPAPIRRSACFAPRLFLTPALYYLPKATLAGTIVVAVLSLVDLSALRRTWAYARRISRRSPPR